MNRHLQLLLGCTLTLTILYFGRRVFIPLSFSLLIACILYPLCRGLEKRGVPGILAIAISMCGLVLFATGLVWLLIWQISGFASEWGQLQIKLMQTWEQLSLWLTNSFQISAETQQEWLTSAERNYGNDVLPVLKTTIGNVSILIVLLILIPIIAALILYERKRLVQVLHAMFPRIQLTELRTILGETIHTYYQFIKGMLVVYICVGILNSVGLLLLGVPHAILFGCIAAILTFIPYVGILIGASLPIVVSWVTFNSIYYPLGVIGIFTFVQYLEANVIFPWAVSSKLNVNTLVTIIAILAGGALWGSSGMILFIPFMGILKLIADRMPGWEPVALLLGGSNSIRANNSNPSASVSEHDSK
jgi:predicted PurR-regulated permease PerM